MRPHICRIAGIVLLALYLPACQTIQDFFPDKQKDYRYSTEIPPLELPPELHSDTIKMDNDLQPQVETRNKPEPAAEAPNANAAAEQPAMTAEKPQQNLVSWTEGNNRLQINAPFEKAWLMTSKALTHKAVEITDRDRSQGVFFVEYDDKKYRIKDGSLWDEVAFFFGYRDSHEQAYRVRVLANGEHTEVTVTDNDNAPVTQAPGLSLLKLIYETIKADAEGKNNSAEDEPQKTDNEEESKAVGEEQRQ